MPQSMYIIYAHTQLRAWLCKANEGEDIFMYIILKMLIFITSVFLFRWYCNLVYRLILNSVLSKKKFRTCILRIIKCKISIFLWRESGSSYLCVGCTETLRPNLVALLFTFTEISACKQTDRQRHMAESSKNIVTLQDLPPFAQRQNTFFNYSQKKKSFV